MLDGGMRAGRGGNETFTGKNVNAAYCAGKESATFTGHLHNPDGLFHFPDAV
jgi:hypothetical protein